MRFNLKTLFVGVGLAAIASIYLGGWLRVFTEGSRKHEWISHQLRQAGANEFVFRDQNQLSYVSFIDEIADPGLPEFVRIDQLDLTGCAGGDISLHHLRNADIWHLMLNSTPASDDSMRELRRVDRLRILDISNTNVTDAAAESIASIRGLKGAYLTGTKITLTGAQAIKKLRPEIWLVHESIGVGWDGGYLPMDDEQP